MFYIYYPNDPAIKILLHYIVVNQDTTNMNKFEIKPKGYGQNQLRSGNGPLQTGKQWFLCEFREYGGVLVPCTLNLVECVWSFYICDVSGTDLAVKRQKDMILAEYRPPSK